MGDYGDPAVHKPRNDRADLGQKVNRGGQTPNDFTGPRAGNFKNVGNNRGPAHDYRDNPGKKY